MIYFVKLVSSTALPNVFLLVKLVSSSLPNVLMLNTIFIIMGKFHDFGKIQFRLSQPKMYSLGTF